MGLKPASLLASLGVGILFAGSAGASDPISAECNDPCPTATCAPAPCVRILPSLCEVFKRRVFDPVCIERPPLLSRLHRSTACVPQSMGIPQSVTSANPQSTDGARPQSAPSNPAAAQGVAQATAPSMVTIPVQSFVMVPVTTWQAMPVTTYQTVSSNSLVAQSFNGIQTASGQSAGANALVELEARLSQVLRASGVGSAQAAGALPCAKTQAELDKRFLELEKRLTELQREASSVQVEASKVLVKHDGELAEIKATLKLLLKAGEDQNARLEKLEKPGKPGDPAKKPDGIPIPLPLPLSK